MYRLAGHLRMTVRRLGMECDAQELINWMAVEHIEPFGGPIDDLRAVIGPTAIINNIRQMFAEGAPMLDPRNVIPWGERIVETVVLHDPETEDYDAEQHAAAIMELLKSKAGK